MKSAYNLAGRIVWITGSSYGSIIGLVATFALASPRHLLGFCDALLGFTKYGDA